MRKRLGHNNKGFTLIELLVVIAIISVLLTILVPSLEKAREQARTTVCMSNLKQWGTMFHMYLSENRDQLFMMGSPDGMKGLEWLRVMYPYYRAKNILMCPATQPAKEPAWGSTRQSWGTDVYGIWAGDTIDDYEDDVVPGSYGINCWISKVHSSWDFWGKDKTQLWNSMSTIGSGDNVPLLLDSWWVGGNPEVRDPPPMFEELWMTDPSSSSNGELQRFCIKRHDRGVGVVFVDGSVRLIKLPELWELKWHAKWKPQLVPQWEFPAWMDK